MQRVIVVLSALVVVTFKSTEAETGRNNLYSKRYEKLDIDAILSSPRLVTNYVDCLLNKKPCPPEGKDLRRIIPEALHTKCGRCWSSQKEGALKVITALYYDYPQHYNALKEKFDPTGEYHAKFEEYLRDRQFNTINGNELNPVSQSKLSSIITSPRTTSRIEVTKRITATQNRDTDRLDTANEINDDIPPRSTRQNLNNRQNVSLNTRFGDEPNESQISSVKNNPNLISPSPSPTPKIIVKTRRPVYVKKEVVMINPLITFLNRITSKFTATAGLIVGMLRTNPQTV